MTGAERSGAEDAGAGEAGAADADQVLDLRVVGGRPTHEELAAVTAVLHAGVAEQAALRAPFTVADGRHWQRANGLLRRPLTPGPGEWRSF